MKSVDELKIRTRWKSRIQNRRINWINQNFKRNNCWWNTSTVISFGVWLRPNSYASYCRFQAMLETSIKWESWSMSGKRGGDWSRTPNLMYLKPIYGVYTNTVDIACSYIIDSLNLFWLSLGWTTCMFVPSIIFASKLYKWFRRMDQEEYFEEFIAYDSHHNK